MGEREGQGQGGADVSMGMWVGGQLAALLAAQDAQRQCSLAPAPPPPLQPCARAPPLALAAAAAPSPLPEPCCTHLARLDLWVRVLRLQQQLHALDGGHGGLGHRAGHATRQQIHDKGRGAAALPAPSSRDRRGGSANKGPRSSKQRPVERVRRSGRMAQQYGRQ